MSGPPGEAALDPAVLERFPDYRAVVLYADGLTNGPSDERSEGRLRAAQETAHARVGDAVADHPHVAAWRRAYAAFGAKPSRFHSSIEALLRRAAKGGVPPINRLVDTYNAISLEHVLPVGGENRDALSGDDVLTFARGDERFETADGGEATTVTADAGEVVWRDDIGITCRRWNWRQSTRTRLTESVTSAFFVLDALAPYPDEALDEAAAALARALRKDSPRCAVSTVRLTG